MSDNVSPGAAFWSFALAIYDRGGVREVCLRLQDDHGLDVMVLFGCLWAGHRGLRLDQTSVTALMAASGPWQAEVTGRLRLARRAARALAGPGSETGPLRSAILDAERAAERVTAELVAGVLSPLRPIKEPEAAAGLANHNLRLYLEASGCMPAEAEEACNNLVKAALA